MKRIGLICEYNPFHNGHIYHIQKIKEMFPDSILILVLNGYFLQRGEVSILNKEDKTKIALYYGIDLVLELPVLFGTQSADIFAEKAMEILHHFQVTDFVFGSECNDPSLLKKLATLQLNSDFQEKVKKHLDKGINYPTALAKALNQKEIQYNPNDLLGISYAKAILKHQYKIEMHTIKRTNSYHDIKSNEKIVSAQNIRMKLKKKQKIDSFVPKEVLPCLQTIDETLLWNLIKHTILISNRLEENLTVDEGIEKRLKKMCLKAKNVEDFLLSVKTKRYTYNKLSRMLIHILLGITKQENDMIQLDYIHILGFSKKGQLFLKEIKKDIEIPLSPIVDSKVYLFEQRAVFLYDMLTNSNSSSFETQNKPIIFNKK